MSTSKTKSQLNASRLVFSWFSAFKVDIDFWCHFGTNLAPFWNEKTTKFIHKSTPKRHQKNDLFLYRFLIDFWSILEANLEPCWPFFRLKRGGAVELRPVLCCVAFFNRFFLKFWPVGPGPPPWHPPSNPPWHPPWHSLAPPGLDIHLGWSPLNYDE